MPKGRGGDDGVREGSGTKSLGFGENSRKCGRIEEIAEDSWGLEGKIQLEVIDSDEGKSEKGIGLQIIIIKMIFSLLLRQNTINKSIVSITHLLIIKTNTYYFYKTFAIVKKLTLTMNNSINSYIFMSTSIDLLIEYCLQRMKKQNPYNINNILSIKS